MTAKLTEKQLRFLDEYLIDLNGAQAAIRAGYSAKTAKEQASRLLTNVHLQSALQAAVEARKKASILSASQALEILTGMATASVKSLVPLCPELDQVPDDQKHLVKASFQLGGKVNLEDPAGVKFESKADVSHFDKLEPLKAIIRYHEKIADHAVRLQELKFKERDLVLREKDFELRKKELEARQREAGNDTKDTEARVWDVPPLKRPV